MRARKDVLRWISNTFLRSGPEQGQLESRGEDWRTTADLESELLAHEVLGCVLLLHYDEVDQLLDQLLPRQARRREGGREPAADGRRDEVGRGRREGRAILDGRRSPVWVGLEEEADVVLGVLVVGACHGVPGEEGGSNPSWVEGGDAGDTGPSAQRGRQG